MSKNTISFLASNVNESSLSYVENNGQFLFSSEEIGKQLEYAEPAKSINNLFKRNQTELEGYSTIIKLMTVDGKQRQVRHFTEEGVYIISMLAATPQAASFRASVAALLRHKREQALELAHEAGYAQGLDYAASAPALEAREAAAYLKDLKEGQDPKKDRLSKVRKAYGYLQKGLRLCEAARLVGMNRATLSDQLQAFGLRPRQKSPKTSTQQASLLQA